MSPLNLPDHRPTRPSRARPNRGPNRGPTRPNFGRQRHPDQPEKPIGQGCVATSLAGEEGIFVAGIRTLALFYPVGTECRMWNFRGRYESTRFFLTGGYMGAGRRVRWLPVARPGRAVAENLAVLSESRRLGGYFKEPKICHLWLHVI